MKKHNNVLLILVQYLSVIVGVIYAIVGALLVLGEILAVSLGRLETSSNPKIRQFGLGAKAGIGNPPNLLTSLGVLLSIIIVISSLLITTFCIYRLIKNVRRHAEFHPVNLKYLRAGMWSILILNVASFISRQFSTQNPWKLFGLQLGGTTVSILVLGTLYTFYVIIKHGIQLQNDSDHII